MNEALTKNRLDFKEWHPNNLVHLLEFIYLHHRRKLTEYILEYEEMLRGN